MLYNEEKVGGENMVEKAENPLLQEEIIKQLKVKKTIDVAKEVENSIQFLVDYLKRYPFFKAYVLGISGGQDSTLAGRLAQLAIERLREETNDDTYQFIAVRLPYGVQKDEEDAQKALDFIQADQVVTIDIKPAVDAAVMTLTSQGETPSDFTKGNMKARERMLIQYSIASNHQGAVIGTDHAAENLTGFFTKFGDGAADVLPLYRLNKRQGRQMLQYLGADAALYEKEPTADLEDDKPLIADEKALGVSYEAIDDYLEGKEVSSKDKATIEKWWQKGEHKRHLPVTLFDTWWKE